MAKITKKTIDKIFEDFKDSLFISDALENNNVRPYDFFEYLEKNEDANKEYQRIERANNFLKEEKIASKVFNGDFSKTILLEMIKANNKNKYNPKIEIETTNTFKSLSDEELDKKIEELQKKLKFDK